MENPVDNLTDDLQAFNLSLLKQKKKKKNPVVRDENYLRLLDLAYSMLPEHTESKHALLRPKVTRLGGKRLVWTNFQIIAQKMNRTFEHLSKFVFTELATEGSVTAKGELVIKGKFELKHLEAVLKKYYTNYVVCKVCEGFDTVLEYNETRVFTLRCVGCRSVYSVAK
jgi:translation initiation factor 2 subunit 2